MHENLRKKGSVYEKIAGEYLQKKGYEILEYNYKSRNAEIDIIARNQEYLIFCEVKFRACDDINVPLEAVNIQKQRKISKAALYYVTTHHMTEVSCRFDVIGISHDEITHIENAFDYIGA